MRKFIFLLAVFFLCKSFALAQDAEKWHTAKSTHFIVYYKNAEDRFLERLIEKAEDYYVKIADDLGFRRYNFWLWDNRAKIYIYDDAKEYQVSTGQPSWSSGATIPSNKIIHTFPGEKGFFETILPHEMGHIIFREFVGFDNTAIPLWLDEGVASYQESSRRLMAKATVKETLRKGTFLNLEKLSQIDPRLLLDPESVNLFYAESVNIVDYLIREFGSDNFVLFCQALRDKKNLEKALAYAYPFRDIKELDKSWQKYLE